MHTCIFSSKTVSTPTNAEQRNSLRLYRQARLEKLRERNVKFKILLNGTHQLPFISFIGMSGMIPPDFQRCSLFAAPPSLPDELLATKLDDAYA